MFVHMTDLRFLKPGYHMTSLQNSRDQEQDHIARILAIGVSEIKMDDIDSWYRFTTMEALPLTKRVMNMPLV